MYKNAYLGSQFLYPLTFALILKHIVLIFLFLLFSAETKNNPSGSFWKLVKIPAVFVVSIIIVISSNVWSFLDPVLEPHLETVSIITSKINKLLSNKNM